MNLNFFENLSKAIEKTIEKDKEKDNQNIPQNLSEEPQNVIVRLEKIGLMYVLDGKIYNPNAKSIDTMKVRLVL